MITIEDIAKEAGVSITTVSRVLNNRGYVAESTRKSVLRAAKKLGRSLGPDFERKRVLLAYASSGQALVESIMAAAQDFNFSLLHKIVASGPLLAEDIAFDGDFDGLILIDGVIDRAELAKLRARVPVVECRNYNDIDREVSVVVDDMAMGYRLTRHLIDTGKTRIATIEFDEPLKSRHHILERMRGYRAALSEAGLSPAGSYFKGFDCDVDAFLAALRRDAGREWDAIIYLEPFDELIELRRLLAEDGHDVPRDIALAAFGDSPVLERGGITATDQPFDAMAQAALFVLDGLINERLTVTESTQLRLEPILSVRDSTEPTPDSNKK